MVRRSVLAAAALVAGSAAQFAQYASGGYSLAVNVPSDTASSGRGPIYLQISAPSGTQWVSFGQGTGMSGSNMLVVYAADSTNVTVSPRLGTGHTQPRFDSDAQVVLLEGSGITSDGSLVANIRCDTCLSWSGGSMTPTDTSSNWIFAARTGSPIDDTSASASISQHGSTGSFNLDLTTGTGGSSTNPFVAASNNPPASDTASAAPSQTSAETATATGTATGTASGSATSSATSATSATSTPAVSTPTNGVSNPIASSNPSSSGASETSSGRDDTVRIAHAVIMSLVFVVLFPLAALTVYLPYNQKIRHIHGPLQVGSLVLMIAGLALGVRLGNQVGELDGYHMVIGYVLFAWMVAFQPALGVLQHLHFRRTGTRSLMGTGHRWVGRAMIALGIVNGGLGFAITGPVGSTFVPNYAVIVYGIFAGLIAIVYVVVLLFPASSSKAERTDALPGEKPRPRTEGYEMHSRDEFNSGPGRF